MGVGSQVTRWRGQIGNTATSPSEGTSLLQLDGGDATWIDIAGDEEAILGMMFPRGNTLWVFKFKAPVSVVEEYRDEFRSFCESVQVL